MSDQSLQQLLVTNFGLLPSGYTGSRGDSGYTGSAGAQGIVGYTGSAGTGGGGGASVTMSTSAPGSPTSGDLWWNTEQGLLKIYYNDGDTAQWVDTTPANSPGSGFKFTSGITAPTDPTPGDRWFNTDTASEFVYITTGATSQWVETARVI